MAILEESCMASADMHLLFCSGEQIVAHGESLLTNLTPLQRHYSKNPPFDRDTVAKRLYSIL